MLHEPTLLESVRRSLSATLHETVELQWIRSLSGGDINHAALLGDQKSNWFLKYNRGGPEGMFAAEAQALEQISRQRCIRVPTPITHGNDGDTAWLLLEYLELTSHGPEALLGEQLAALHAISSDRFGWSRDNFIGTTAQINAESNHWSAFWRANRLEPQLSLAHAAGHNKQLADKGEKLLENLDYLMEDHQPIASLLHGDLWAGNKAFTRDGQPVIFDPASYYGDRETDIAMTELFGGFGPEFYSAYNAHLPLPGGYEIRRDLYNLYHMLNHLNLFGTGYLSRCEKIIDHLLAQVR